MIDFKNGSIVKLRQVSSDKFDSIVQDILVGGESVLHCFQGVRDYVLFTNRRVMVVNVQGVIGKKQEFSSLPYSRIQAFSVETSGVLDLDSELELWFSGLGKIRLEFTGGVDMKALSRLIGESVL